MQAEKYVQKIKIPDKVEVTINEEVKVKGPNGEVVRKFSHPRIKIRKEGDEVVLEAESPTKKERAIVGTFVSHINNMFVGVTDGFEYKLKVVFSHFPITVKVQGKEILVENYLGEKIPRKTSVVGSCTVKVKGQEISIFGANVEEVGQTAANLEQLTRAKNRDRRVFQDGIYIVEKAGVKLI